MSRIRTLAVAVITPAPRGTHTGNRVTALRWAKRLRELGHRVSIAERFDDSTLDCLVALHAVKSADSIQRCHEKLPHIPIVVALTGTDVYGDHATSPGVLSALEIATAIVALQPLALETLPPSIRSRARVIYQSATPV